MERFEFIRYAPKLGIPYQDLTDEDLENDIKSSKTVSGDEELKWMKINY